MAADRDDFSPATKKLLADRVGVKCSNPNCRQPTSGPQDDPTKAVNLGVAAHITAAAPGGPRYDPSLTPEERSSADNGIWCCQNHGKLVDNDLSHYTVEKLREWKKLAEDTAQRELEEGPGAGGSTSGTERLSAAAHEAAFGIMLADRTALGEVVDQDTQVRLDAIRDTANQGRPLEAIEEIRRMRAETARWSHLRPATRARALRMQASILLQRGDTTQAEALVRRSLAFMEYAFLPGSAAQRLARQLKPTSQL